MDFEIKNDTIGSLSKFVKKIELEFNGSLTDPKASVTFDAFKIEMDKKIVPSFGMGSEHSSDSAKVKFNLKAMPPVGATFIFAGSAEVEKELGSMEHNKEKYKASLEGLNMEVIVSYTPSSDKDIDNSKNTLTVAEKLYVLKYYMDQY